MSEILGIIALTVVAPIWIVSHYVTKWRLAKGLTSDEAQTLEDLWKLAQRMETRVRTLEEILDANADNWRNKS
jgi:phage shock protein B